MWPSSLLQGHRSMRKEISRRQFLRADFHATRSALRPPWALPEADFIERCTRCGDCLRLCPQAILQSDGAGFPLVDFTQHACTFCASCLDACKSGALTFPHGGSRESVAPWQAKAVVDDRCLTQRGVCCEVCRDHCTSRAIHFRPVAGQVPRPHVDTSACSGCGACVSVCPVSAIQAARMTNAQRNVMTINAEEAT